MSLLRPTILLLAGLLAGPLAAAADEFVPLPLVAIERQGYAFEYPRVLAQQRLFGIQHGVQLLVVACRALPAETETVEAAHVHWLEKQQPLIESMHAELAQYYFGPRADEATRRHIVRALNLRESLNLAPESAELKAACATLPAALALPRYDLGSLFALEEAMAAVALATRADVHTEKCSERLPEQAAMMRQHYQRWQERQGLAPQQARQNVPVLWKTSARPGEADEWFAILVQRYSQPSAIACEKLTAWLDSEAADLAANFTVPPLPANPEALLAKGAEQEAAVAVTIPVSQGERMVEAPPLAVATPEAPPPEAPVAVLPAEPASPLQHLFELLMKVLSNDPSESAEAEPRSGSEPGAASGAPRLHP